MLSGLPSCAGIETTSESAPGVDFSAYGTYAWALESSAVGAAGSRVDDDELAARIRAAADVELAALGMRSVAPGEADLLLAKYVSVEEQLQLNDPYFEYETVERVEIGTLTIDATDARTNRRVWRGSGRCRLRLAARGTGLYTVDFVDTPGHRDWRVDDLVDALFDGFPKRAAD